MDKQTNKTPLVRFPEFKDDWKHKQLNKLLSVSKTTNKDLKYGKEEVLSVSGESGIVNQIEHLGRSYAGVSVHNYGVVELNQIVYTKSPLKANPFGIIKLNKRKVGIVSTLYAVYNVNQETDGQFIEYYFSLDANLNRYLRPLVRKGAKNTLQVTDEEAIKGKLPFPQLPEQKKIAHFFSIVDQKINQLQEKLNGLELYKKGMMQQIFSQKLRFKPAQSEVEGDYNGQDFPDWEVKNLGEVCEINMGQSPNSSSYNTQEIGKYLIQGNADIFDRKTKPRNWTSEPTKFCEIDDIIMTVRAPVGAIARSSHNACIGRGVCSIKNNSNNNLDFIYQILLNYENKWDSLAQGSTFTAVSGKDIRDLKFNFPSLNEQTKIANFLSKIDDKINAVNAQIEITKTYKKGLLQKMFV